MPSRETLVVNSSGPNCEALATREVLAHPRAATFHPSTCVLRRGATIVATTLIGYNDIEVAAGTNTRRRRSWSTTFSTPTSDYVGLWLQLFFHCSARLVVTINDLLLESIFTWYGRSSASVAYPYPYIFNFVSCLFLDDKILLEIRSFDERLSPDLSRIRGKSIDGNLNVDDECSEQNIKPLQSLHHYSVGY
jgi:hypothetical protein